MGLNPAKISFPLFGRRTVPQLLCHKADRIFDILSLSMASCHYDKIIGSLNYK